MTVSTPQTPLSFRPATPSDVPTLLPLIRSAYRGEFSRKGWTTEADLVADQRIDERGLLAKIIEPEGAVLIVTDDSADDAVTEKPTTPLACCEIVRSQQDPRVAYFGLFAVSPERQAGGVGRRVLEFAEGHAKREWGVARMEMCVLWMRGELIAWYERRGYVKTGERREFPYKEMVGGVALRDDLWFEVLEKGL
ncbi:acetyltransferase [Colletotrichum abscissum]|uniref:Acetyltransferase n=1 Tax=Colletotrichum abscissum TaxID=1671311 RepID=A0A9P9XFP9_9PEZI|nr:acetyltransferase [Colletotrichum abscissum]KAI3552781.1 acetyltransferase [Colletotrichum abscissum]KAK1503664.1 acetyltransferase [Colletotrichum abscissum]